MTGDFGAEDWPREATQPRVELDRPGGPRVNATTLAREMSAAEDIEDAFWFLDIKLGYQRSRYEHAPAPNGNASVDYRSPGLWVKVTKDRGQFFCDFSAPRGPTEWFDLEIVLRDLGEDRAADDLIAQKWSSLDALASCVEQTIDRIRAHFSEDAFSESRVRLKEGQLRRVRKHFGDTIADQLISMRGGNPPRGG